MNFQSPLASSAILVQIDFYKQERNLEEFKELVKSLGVSIKGLVQGKAKQPEAKFLVGMGKSQEIKTLVNTIGPSLVIFNHDLTPGQQRNLENLLGCSVLDRTQLILEIFAKRARTFEGKLQVELAKLQHLSTRLVRGWSHLERQRGGIGLRGGPGEKQLETDRRLISLRIKSIHKRLGKVSKQRKQSRRLRKRKDFPTVTLVGYTNVGKSTLFNVLTHANVYVANQLFATLDPTLRLVQVPKVGKILLGDTVGFIQDLPHLLIAAFRATLEEIKASDLLLHVIDANTPHPPDLIAAVKQVLNEIEAGHLNTLQVWNKIDLRPGFEARIDRHENGKPWRVWVSASSGEGLGLLHQAMAELLLDPFIECSVSLTPKESKLRSELYTLGVVQQESHDAQGMHRLQLSISHKDFNRLFTG